MKKFIIFFPAVILLFVFTPEMLNAQEAEKQTFNTKKTEFNIAVTNIFAKNDLWPYYYIDGNGDYIYYSALDYYPSRKLLVGLKFHNPKGAVRLGTTLHYSSNTYKDSDNGDEIDQKRSMLETGFYIGYQWQKTIGRVNIYYGFDGSFMYAKNKTEVKDVGYYDYVTNNSLVSGAISPLLGVNCFITPNLSIGTEVKLDLEYSSGKHKTTNSYDGQTDENKSTGFRARFGPMGFLSINIHF